MSENSELISQLFSEYKYLFTPEEEKILLRSDPQELELLYQRKIVEFRNNAALTNMLQPSLCDYDCQGAEVTFFRLFSSIKNAKNRLLYAQSVSTMKCPSSHYTKRTNMDSYLLTYTSQGQGALEYQDKRYTLKPGTAFLIDCRQPHFYYADSPEGWSYEIIHFNGLNMPEFFSAITASRTFAVSFSEDSMFVRHLQELKDACKQLICNEFTMNMLLTCLLTDIINATQVLEQTKMPAWLEQAVSYMNVHASEDLSLDELAQIVCVSKYYLAREFKRFTGQTVNEYLRSVRMNTAKGLLTATNLPVSVIAEMVGYQSQYHFISLFKSFEGTTPLQYRKQWTSSST